MCVLLQPFCWSFSSERVKLSNGHVYYPIDFGTFNYDSRSCSGAGRWLRRRCLITQDLLHHPLRCPRELWSPSYRRTSLRGGWPFAPSFELPRPGRSWIGLDPPVQGIAPVSPTSTRSLAGGELILIVIAFPEVVSRMAHLQVLPDHGAQRSGGHPFGASVLPTRE